MMKTTAILFAALILTGCATTTKPTPANEAKQAPASRVLAFQAKPNGQYGKIVVTRDTGMVGSLCTYAVRINKIAAARLEQGEVVVFNVPAGEVLLQSGRDTEAKGPCGMGSINPTVRETILKDGETKHFRLTINAEGVTDIQRTGI